MNRDDIIRMAIKCQLVTTSNRDGIYADALQRFAALVAAAAEQPKPKPVGVMQESCVMEGLVIPVVTQELPVGTPLYAAPPDTEALRRETERLNAEIESWRQTMAAATILGEKVTAENERLRDELRQSSIDITRAEVERLREEIASLRTDAERYRWHRANIAKHMGHSLEVIDAATDAEMKEAALQGETAIWAARHDPRE